MSDHFDYQRIFGWTPADTLGESLDLIIPERNRSAHWTGYEKTMATGETRYGNDLLRVPALHKDGRAMSIAFTVAMLMDGQGRVQGVAAVIRDDTVRFNEDRAMRRRIAELEQTAARSAA